MTPLPTLRRQGRLAQLIVDDAPFLVLGGELGNSSASDLGVLDESLRRCAELNLNTVLCPIEWDLLEPRENDFDFTLVRGAIDLARTHKLRLMLLWFGTYKNSMSCYAPSWVKRETQRFPRVRRSDGGHEEIISPFCTQARDCDAKAFAALMTFVREHDAQHRSVIGVQVENEIGMIPEPRDHSDAADDAWAQPVPVEILDALKTHSLGPELAEMWSGNAGTWSSVFGQTPLGEEVFTAWHFARFVEHVTRAGKAIDPLPMFTNAALIRPGYLPGKYPSGGPLPHLLELWRLGAPSLDMICPDIYFPNFIEWTRAYDRSDNAVFIPEMAASLRASGNAMYAIGACGAIGTCPFAIEDLQGEHATLLSEAYALLAHLAPQLLAAQQRGAVIALSPRVNFDWSIDESLQSGTLAEIVFTGVFDREAAGDASTTTLPTLGSGRWDAPPGTPLGAVLILQNGQDTFLMLGMGARITFAPKQGVGRVGIDSARELMPTPRRWLNGDQTHQGRHIHFPQGRWSLQEVTVYRY